MKQNFLVFAGFVCSRVLFFSFNSIFLTSFFLSSFLLSSSCPAASVPLSDVNNFHNVLSPKSMSVLRESGFNHWDLKLAIMGTQERGLDAYSWLEDYHKAQEERSKPAWRQQSFAGPVPDLPSAAERNAKEKELVLAVLSLLKENAKREADQQENIWEKNEVARKKDNKCWWMTAAILSVGALISGVVPCAHR